MKKVQFPLSRDIVYIVGIESAGTFVPFYVGETSRGVVGRLGDHITGNFVAPTDFKVGEAIKCLRDCHHVSTIVVKFKESSPFRKDRRIEEQGFIEKLHRKYDLLNCEDEFNYDYKRDRDRKDQIRKDIHAWVDRWYERVSH